MEVPPDLKDFSLLEQALKVADTPLTDLGRISNISRRDFLERETFLFRAKAPCIEYACLLIENALLLQTNRKGRVYAGFEKLSCMKQVIDRYLRIADISEYVYVFGEADWKPPRHPNMRLIKLPPDARMAREWFLVADSSTLRIAIVAFDEAGFGSSEPEQRTFTAFKSSNPKVVARLASAAEGLIDWSIAA
jgi:Sensory domain in DIguanylate Cyclases and Two-component system